MTQYAHLDPAAFFLEGGSTGILLIHGFTGSPPEMRRVGDYLAARRPHRLRAIAARAWRHAGGDEPLPLDRLDRPRRTVAGRSPGALYISLRRRAFDGIAAHALPGSATPRPPRRHRLLSGDMGCRPADLPSPVAKHFVLLRPKSGESDLVDPEAERRLWSYDVDPVAAADELLKLSWQVRRLLPRITCPLLVIHSTGDHAIHPDSARRTFGRAGSADKQLLTLHESGHCITVDRSWESVAAADVRFHPEARRIAP